MDVGFELRQTRERRGMSLQQLSRITKINLRVLDAIEASDADRLPAAVFTRSFVRTYAAEIGLDPDDIWRRYLEQFDQPVAVAPATAEPDPVEPADNAPPWPRARVLYGRFGQIAVLVLVGLTAFALSRSSSDEPQAKTTPQAAPTVSAAGVMPSLPSEAQPVGTAGTAVVGGLQLTIAPIGPCWVQATVNGERIFATELRSGDRRNVDAPSEVTLRVGDPATFVFTINGKPARVGGVAGQAVTVQITKENFAQFLVRS